MKVSINTTSDDIRSDGATNEVRGQSVTGDIAVRMPAGTQAELHCTTRHGDLRQRIPSVSGASCCVFLNSTSGDIVIE